MEKKSEFALENFSELLDDKMSKNIISDLRKHLPPGGFNIKNKPLLVPSAGAAPLKRSVDNDLMVSMTQRLKQLEQVNKALKSEAALK